MAIEKYEDLADLILSQTGMDWDLIQADMHETSTEDLIDGLTSLELYVNKKFAQEIAKRDDAVFYLRKLLQDGKHWRGSGPGDGWSPLHAIHILALIKSTVSFELLLDIIRYHEDDLGDWVTDDVASLLVAFGEDFIKQHLTKLLKTTQDGTFAGIVADELVDVINGVFFDMDERDFKRNTADPLNHFSRENIERLYRINYEGDDEDEEDEEFEDEIDTVIKDDYSEPAMKEIKSEEKKIGRNDPCSCGSGKKYKKCCMGKEKS